MERKPGLSRRFNRNTIALTAAAAVLLAGGAVAFVTGRLDGDPDVAEYPLRQDITTTVFWVGEGADESNDFIHNRSSTWIVDWVGAYGGVDEREPRCDHLPCDFTPKENPFYFALPYNDLDGSCQTKPSQMDVPWFEVTPPAGHSLVKNRWIEIRFEDKVAYAQWEDSGPFGEDDTDYVFGDADPQSEPGLDVSPAVASYLGLSGRDQTDWRFVTEEAVPNGPWRQIITTSLPDCATARD